MTGTRSLLILPCSETKRHDSNLLPAWQRYRGRVFRSIDDAFPTLHADRTIDVMIISALYGIVTPASLIHDYDQRMTFERRAILGPVIRRELCDLVAANQYRNTFVLLEPSYLSVIDLSDLPSPIVETDLSDTAIEHLKWWIAVRATDLCESA